MGRTLPAQMSASLGRREDISFEYLRDYLFNNCISQFINALGLIITRSYALT